MRNFRKWLIVSLAILVLLAAIIHSIITPPALPDFLANRTDGYEKILAAIQELDGDPRDATNNIAAYIETNKHVFEKYAALSNERMEAPPTFYNPATMGTDFMDFRRFSNALLLKAKLAEQQQDWTAASHLCLETIRFGQNIENGPLINFLVGTGIELSAIKRLAELLPSLPQTNLINLAAEFTRLHQTRPPFEAVLERERYYFAKNSTNLIDLVKNQITFRRNQSVKGTEERSLQTTAHLQVLAAEFAARLYTLDHKTSPKSLAGLVPKYLPAILLDPFANAPLILTNSTATNTLIYSIGLNKRDDAGKSDDIILHYKHPMARVF